MTIELSTITTCVAVPIITSTSGNISITNGSTITAEALLTRRHATYICLK